MTQWMLTVRRAAPGPRVALSYGDDYRRAWSGRPAQWLCRRLGLRPGTRPCPKDCVWRFFLLAHAMEGEQTMLDESRCQHPAPEVSPPVTEDTLYWNRRLRDHGLLPTRPRRMIARRILGVTRHFTAEDLMHELREAGCRCARATVYNTLNEFAEQGLLRPLHVDAGPVIYDTVTTPHAHLHNRDTGELTDLAGHREWLRALPELPPGVSLESVQLVFQVRETTPEMDEVMPS